MYRICYFVCFISCLSLTKHLHGQTQQINHKHSHSRVQILGPEQNGFHLGDYIFKSIFARGILCFQISINVCFYKSSFQLVFVESGTWTNDYTVYQWQMVSLSHNSKKICLGTRAATAYYLECLVPSIFVSYNLRLQNGLPVTFESKYIWWISLYFSCMKIEFLNEVCRVTQTKTELITINWYRYFEGLGKISTKYQTFGIDLSKYVKFAIFSCCMFSLHGVKHFLLVITKSFFVAILIFHTYSIISDYGMCGLSSTVFLSLWPPTFHLLPALGLFNMILDHHLGIPLL